MIRVALTFLLGIALADPAHAADWEILGTPEKICAKTRESCEMAIEATRDGRVFRDLRAYPMRCAPAPGCFSEDSNCIAGYNCR